MSSITNNVTGSWLTLACRDALLQYSKWNLCGIRVLFRTDFEYCSKGIHLYPRAPFFRSFFGGQRKDNGRIA